VPAKVRRRRSTPLKRKPGRGLIRPGVLDWKEAENKQALSNPTAKRLQWSIGRKVMPVTTIRPEPEVAGSNRLPVLAATINEHLEAAEAATRRGLEHAIAAGALLIETKELIAHGDWLPWLKANCRGLSARQAQIYMRLARNRHKLTALKNAPDSHLTIAAAVALVGKPKPERPPGLPGQLDFLGGPEVPLSTPTPTELERTDRKAAFLERCEQAIGSATYAGPLDDEVADAAERVAAAWDRKARELRGKVRDAKAFDARKMESVS
jgi:hypothetical protein